MEERKEQAGNGRKTKTGSRRLIAVVLILAVVAVLIGFAGYSVRNLYRYENAVSLLRESKYADASKAFEALGEYRDAASYLIYARAAQAGEDGDFRTAVQNLKALNGFGDSSLLAVYYDARALEEEGLYENAQELCDELEKKTGIPVVLMDANDIDQNQLGKCADFPLTDDQIQDAMKDNPSGQGDELTPLILIRPVG